ncbi:AlpA family phage regulatory protein [Zhongshania sp.]|uniref:helix-turn-helix transcriptional regulator n=1 Tax=Zhongshania sp. TaxID=1971902 RepID=UPI0034594ACC
MTVSRTAKNTTGRARPTAPATAELTHSRLLPDVGLVRLKTILGDSKANPPIPAIIPVSASHWWSGVKTGRYPKPVKLSANCTAWHVEDIRALLIELSRGEK